MTNSHICTCQEGYTLDYDMLSSHLLSCNLTGDYTSIKSDLNLRVNLRFLGNCLLAPASADAGGSLTGVMLVYKNSIELCTVTLS